MITITLKNTEAYQHDLGIFGDEEGAIITRQALHYDTSEVDRSFTASTVYRYRPSLGYVGTDEVEIRSDRDWNGGTSHNNVEFTIIKFTLVE